MPIHSSTRPTSFLFYTLIVGLLASPVDVFATPPDSLPELEPLRAASAAAPASPPSCDFEMGTCKISEGELLTFDIFFNSTLPICIFVDPRTLPPGASFPAQTGVGHVGSTFEWTPHECQAGEHVVHFRASFFCFDFFFGSLFVITITVNDAEDCLVMGACCLPDGTCQDLSEEECRQRRGSFGQDTTCEITAGPLICPLELGACCKGDGTCVDDETEETCDLFQGGEFLGVGSSCPTTSGPNVCNGACSTSGFACVDGVTKDQCEALTPHNGHFRGAGTTCATTPPGSGACCFPDGGCFHLPHERDCRNRLGKFQGVGTLCPQEGGDVVCPVTGGSCCPGPMPQFTGCRTAEPLRCALLGGVTVAPDACPTGTKCPPASGACCIFDDLTAGGGLFCVDGSSPAGCTTPDLYLGDGSKCGDDDNDGVDNCCDQCPNTPPGEPVIPCQIIIVGDNFSGCSCTQRPQICNDNDSCTRDVCAPRDSRANSKGCVNLPDPTCCETDADCNDNDECTTDLCSSVTRRCVNNRINCQDDGIPCTIDQCHRVLGCNYPDHARCDDRNPCTIDMCVPEQGCTNMQKVCNDTVFCTLDLCNALTGNCRFVPDDVLCYDNDPCTTDTCDPTHPDTDGDGCVHTPTRRGETQCGDGDYNGDGVTDLNDLRGQTDCLDQGGPFTTVDSECPPADFDGDTDVDLGDWQFAMNDPFRCDRQNCEAGIGGKCVTTCELDEICDPDATVATGQTGGECKRPCTSEIDCFSVGKCEACTDGFCKTRCDPMLCENPCDGAGNCPSRCLENEQCVNGECKRTCFDDRDCNLRRCETCQDGVCAFGCPPEKVCTLEGCGGPACTRREDCPPCHICVPVEDSNEYACVPCEQAGEMCRDGRCLSPCREGLAPPCVLCERCEDDFCVNDCPKGQLCSTIDGLCHGGCTSDADCGRCEVCFFDWSSSEQNSYCVSCKDNFPCVRCDDDGACVYLCDRNACERCTGSVAGPCVSRCNSETEMCDGMGNCVPQ